MIITRNVINGDGDNDGNGKVASGCRNNGGDDGDASGGGDRKRKVGCEDEADDDDGDDNDNGGVDDSGDVDINDSNYANGGDTTRKTDRDYDADVGESNFDGGVVRNRVYGKWCVYGKGGDEPDYGDEQTKSAAGDLQSVS